MEIDIAQYHGHYIRFALFSDNDVLLNTDDICRILRIAERPAKSILSEACMNIIGVVQTAMVNDGKYMDFVNWLKETFVGCNMKTPIIPNCEPDWII